MAKRSETIHVSCVEVSEAALKTLGFVRINNYNNNYSLVSRSIIICSCMVIFYFH